VNLSANRIQFLLSYKNAPNIGCKRRGLRRWLAEQGYDPQLGARPLRRALQKYVESPMSVQILRGTIQRGMHVAVDKGTDELEFKMEEAAKDAVENVVDVSTAYIR